MPFSHIGGFIARLVEIVRQVLDIQGQLNAVGVAPGLGGILTALQAGPGRPTHWLAGKGVFKKGALLGQLVQIGAHRQALTVASQSIPPLLIGKIKHNIRTFLHKPSTFQ